jgi:hypothetical protein
MMFEVQTMEIPVGYEKPRTEHLYRLFFDIEGSLTYTGDVIQLAYLLTDWDFKIITSYSKYFRNHVPITEEEQAVHGLSARFLWENADHHFSLELPNLDIFRRENLMHVSYTDFDIRKFNEQCVKSGIDEIDFGVKANSLKTVPKKVNCFDAFSIKGRALQQSASQAQKAEAGEFTKGGAHDALYDTYLMYVLCRDYYRAMP